MLYLVQSGTIQVRESLGGQTLATATDETLKLQPAIKKHTACAHARAHTRMCTLTHIPAGQVSARQQGREKEATWRRNQQACSEVGQLC